MILIYDDYNSKIIRGGVIGTITPQAGNKALKHNYKIITMENERPKKVSELKAGVDFDIRKLTPRECFRLMDVTEEDIDKIQNAGISSSQQYKMAGNSIVVSCLVHIMRQMFRPQWYGDTLPPVEVKVKTEESKPQWVEQALFADDWFE